MLHWTREGAGRQTSRSSRESHPPGTASYTLIFPRRAAERHALPAIEILPGLPERQRPVRIVTRDVPYYSDDSRWWGPDNYFKGGQITASDQPAADEDDPELFETERWGHFSYAIPVAPGRYTATVYFVERRFDAANRDRYGDSEATRRGGAFSAFSAMEKSSCAIWISSSSPVKTIQWFAGLAALNRMPKESCC